MATSSARQEVDKKLLYGRFQKSEDDRAELMKKAAYKALDLKMDDDLNVTNTKTGIGALGVMGIAAAAGLPGVLLAGLLGWSMLGGGQPAVAPVGPGPADSEYEIRFYDKDGNLIDVPRRPAE